MKAAFIAAIAFVVAFSVAATDDHSTVGAASGWFPKTWGADKGWAFGNLDGAHDSATAISSMKQADDQWNANAGTWFDFIYYGQNSTVNWTGNPCTMSSAFIWVVSANESNPGATQLCTSGSSITRATVRLDDVGQSWYVGTGTPGAGEQDSISILTHEFGHAAGFVGHFSGSSCSQSYRETMCPSHPAGVTWWRSLEAADRTEIANAY